jgi:AraC-like DNA-binding protein
MIRALLTRTGTIDPVLRRACESHQVILTGCSKELECAAVVSRVNLVLVEPRDSLGQCTAPLVRRIRQRRPEVHIAVYCPLNPTAARDLVELIKAGADEALLIGFDDPGAWIRRRALMFEQTSTSTGLLEALRPLLPAAARDLVTYCLREALSTPTVAGAAERLGVHRKTLVNRMAAAGLPSPGVCVAWCRLLLAFGYLEGTGHSVERVALEQGFGSATSLRKMCRHYTGLPLSELRQRGGVRHLVSLFLAELEGDVTRSESA